MGKVANLESMVLGDCPFLLEHIIIIRRSCFDTDFAVQIKLTKLPLIHCFVFEWYIFFSQAYRGFPRQAILPDLENLTYVNPHILGLS